MRFELNANSILTGAFSASEGQGEAVLTLSAEVGAERNIEAAARLGMRREGASVVRLEGENANDLAAQAVRGYFHGAFRISKDAIRGLKDVYAQRDALCDYGPGALCIDCDSDVAEGIRAGLTLARCEGYARMLGTLPNNFLHVRQMADYIRHMAADCGLTCRVLGDGELKMLGCGGILAVNQGSDAPAALAVLEWRPCDGAPVALVGKGVMFDAGGYHLKNLDGMNGMQSDMCGAATVTEAMEYIARTGASRPVIAVLPLVENVISARSVKMGDVITTLSGKTVEVYNTDAEGRLILCDALTYAQRMGAKDVADIATLTYGCQSALGDETGGWFCNDETVSRSFERLIGKTGEPFWRLPLHERYHRALKWSEVADLGNYAPGYGAAASTAACFLEEFIEPGTRWLHLDIVGPATRRGGCDTECKGARGFGLSTLVGLVQA